jgi:hypothetical protein
MAIRGCGLPAHCCQPAVAGGVIYADLRGELNTPLAPQALFTQNSPVHEPLLQAFPFPSTLGKVTLHLLSQACVFIYSSREKWVSPLFCGVFLPLLHLQAFPLLIAGRCCCSCWPACLFTAHVGGGSSPSPVGFSSLSHSHKFSHFWLLNAHPRQARVVYLQFWEGFPSPLLWSSGHPNLFATCLYCSYCFLLSFSFFPGWGSVYPGGYADLAQGCLWKYRILLSSPCPRLPKLSESRRLAAQGPSWFLLLM